MKTTRMFAFVTAVVTTASLLFVIAYGLPVPQATQAVAGTATDTQSTPD